MSAPKPWAVTVYFDAVLPHQPPSRVFYFGDEGQARMFLHSCRRDGDRAALAKAGL